MNQLLLIGVLVVALAALLMVRIRRSPKRRERWMPDIRLVV
jgi:hypothetical protein